jgi:lipid-A-disaccharide synthase-like uncharacterized protein
MWPLLGTLGLVLIELSYLSQVRRLWVLKHADDISYFFPALNLTGRLLAFSYAMHLGEAVFGAGFLLGIVIRSTLLGQVLYYRRRSRPALHLITPDATAAGSKEVAA